MKRIASLLICALVVISSCVLFAVPASAAEKVVYVKDEATGDGSSASSPIGTLDAALKALASTGGTIKVVDYVTIAPNTAATAEVTEYYTEPAHDRQITITSADPANKAQFIMPLECQWYALAGPTVFENIKIVNNTFDQHVRFLARGNHITMGEGLEMYLGETLQTTADVFVSSMKGVVVQGLTNIGAEYDGMMDDNTWITVKSGVYFLIQGYTRNFVDTGDLTGNCYMEFEGEIAVRQMGWATLKAGLTCSGQAYIYWNANIANWRIFPGYDVATDPFTVNLFIHGGDHVNADGAKQTMVGAGKVKTVNLWYDETNTEASDLAMHIVNSYIITQPDGGVFPEELKNYKGDAYRLTEDVAPLDDSASSDPAVTTEATVDTTADAVVTTEAVADTTDGAGEVTPPTGDASVMIVLAAAVAACLFAVVIVKKKER